MLSLSCLSLGLTQSRPAVSEGGGEEPGPAPEGFAYLVDGESTTFIVNAEGDYFIVPIS
jgi:hypothetical protein